MRRGVRIVGYLLVALAIGGLSIRVTMAAASGQPFVGENVFHLPIGTYSTLIVLIMAAAIGVYALIKRIRGPHR